MAESIQCYQCGTRMTLEELSNNDGDCPECDVEIHLAEYLSKALAEIAELRAQLPSQGGEAVAWREHSVNYAKGEKCPETIETLQAAWDRDQELINDMRHEIARHKTRINRLEQRRPADQVACPDAELVELIGECRGIVAREVERWNRVAAFLLEDGKVESSLLSRIDAKLASLKGEP